MLETSDLGLAAAAGEQLDQDAYNRDFFRREWTIDGLDSWKLERRQHFQEPKDESWRAFSEGRWEESLRLAETYRDSFREFSEKAERHRVALFRIRVVEQPIVPYLQWELNLLRLRAEYGEKIRVVGPDQVRALEKNGPLPELLTLGDTTLYRILYDDAGIADGAVRYTDPALVTRCRRLMEEIYAAGEELSSYYAREVAHLPPPRRE